MNVTISPDAERRLWAFIRAVKTEIGGMGYAWLDEDGIYISDVFLIPQEVSGSIVDFEVTDADTVAVQRAIDDGVLNEPSFVWFSWHSHHTMKAFWSGTDDDRIEGFGTAGVKRLLSLVGCHDGTYKLRFDAFNVDCHGYKMAQITQDITTLHSDPSNAFEAEISKEIAANVTELKPKWKKNSYTPPKKKDPPKQLTAPKKDGPPIGQHTDGSTLSVGEAFDVKELMDDGYSYAEALYLVENDFTVEPPLSVGDNGYFVGPEGLIEMEVS